MNFLPVQISIQILWSKRCVSCIYTQNWWD